MTKLTVVSQTKHERVYVFSPEELAYALALIGSEGIVGLSDPIVAPSPDQQNPVFDAGLKQLKANGWLTVAERPDTWHLDEDLLQAVLILSKPICLIQTIRDINAPSQALQFYFGQDGIVELAQMSDGKYRLTGVADIAAVAQHSVELLNWNNDHETAASSLPKETEPMSGPQGELVVARVQDNQIVAGRVITIHGYTTISFHKDQKSPDLEKHSLNYEVLKNVIERFLTYLMELDPNGSEA